MTTTPPKPLSFGTGCLWLMLFSIASLFAEYCIAALGAPPEVARSAQAVTLVALIAGGFVLRHRAKKQFEADQQAALAARFASLAQRWGHEAASQIMAAGYWQGQTHEQLFEALGRPADIDEEVLKSRTKHTWKYYPQGANRFGLRIMLEDGIVVGWKR